MSEKIRWHTLDALRAAVLKGEPIASDVGVRASFVPEVVKEQAEGESRPTYRFVISTDSVDRGRDVISVEGWNLKNFKKNPVVLWAHDYHMLPLGRALKVEKVDGKLVSSVRFDSDISPMAKMVEQMVERGTLRATSVGFRPGKYALNETRGGIDFMDDHELLEWSIVPIPMNADALAEAKGAGIDVTPLLAWWGDLGRSLLQAGLIDGIRDIGGVTYSVPRQTGSTNGYSNDVANGMTVRVVDLRSEAEQIDVQKIRPRPLAEALVTDPESLRLIGRSIAAALAAKAPKPECPRGSACPSGADDAPEKCSDAKCPLRGQAESGRAATIPETRGDEQVLALDDDDEIGAEDFKTVFGELAREMAETAVRRMAGRID